MKIIHFPRPLISEGKKIHNKRLVGLGSALDEAYDQVSRNGFTEPMAMGVE